MIREAVTSDVPAVMSMMGRFYEASEYSSRGLSLCRPKLEQLLHTAIERDDHLLLVAEMDGRQVGLLLAMAVEPYMSEDLMAVELAWWVEDEARGTGCAVRMMLALEKWAAARGCSVVSMSSLCSIHESPADSIYERCGYQQVETAWFKNMRA